MTKQNDVLDIKTLAKAFTAIAFVLWSVLPMHILGWLISAVARHSTVDQELQGEPVYWVIIHWQGGIKSFPPVVLLIFFFCVLFVLSYALRKHGYSEPVDGMKRGRVILRKFLIPSFLSTTAFATGVMSRGNVKTMAASTALLLCFAIFAAVVHYFVDTTEFE